MMATCWSKQVRHSMVWVGFVKNSEKNQDTHITDRHIVGDFNLNRKTKNKVEVNNKPWSTTWKQITNCESELRPKISNGLEFGKFDLLRSAAICPRPSKWEITKRLNHLAWRLQVGLKIITMITIFGYLEFAHQLRAPRNVKPALRALGRQVPVWQHPSRTRSLAGERKANAAADRA